MNCLRKWGFQYFRMLFNILNCSQKWKKFLVTSKFVFVFNSIIFPCMPVRYQNSILTSHILWNRLEESYFIDSFVLSSVKFYGKLKPKVSNTQRQCVTIMMRLNICVGSLFWGFIASNVLFKKLATLKHTVKKKLYGPFLWMGFYCLKARATSRRQFTFYH